MDFNELGVRIGMPEDVHDVMELALEGVEDNGFFPPDKMKILQEIWSALNLNRGLVGIIADEGSKPEAAVLLRIGPLWYSSPNVVEEKSIFVRPQYRSSRRAKRLIEFTKIVSEQLKIPLFIGILSNTRTATKIKLYERLLGAPAGAFFIYGATNGQTGESPTIGTS